MRRAAAELHAHRVVPVRGSNWEGRLPGRSFRESYLCLGRTPLGAIGFNRVFFYQAANGTHIRLVCASRMAEGRPLVQSAVFIQVLADSSFIGFLLFRF